jgi:hypothetical protein
MIHRVFALSIIIMMSALVLGGCGGDSIVPTNNEQNNTSGLVQGEIDESSGSFEYVTETGGEPNRPLPGPFIIRGSNIHYVDSLSVLSVDFTVEHQCRCTYHEPVALTFVVLLPTDVTVENPDNDEHGPGAQIIFEFANDDGMWTTNEESLPRTVHFGVDSGVSIGFAARIDVGMDETGGSIGGVVWHDANENGVIDNDEKGIGGVVINMMRTDGPEWSNLEILWRTVTAHDGSYRFDGLDAAPYRVERIPNEKLRPTTPGVLHVVLVEENGEVSDFLMANFGCVPADPAPGPVIRVGDYVEVAGLYSDVGPDQVKFHRIEAREIGVVRCSAVEPPQQTSTLDGNCDDWGPTWPCLGRNGALGGPVIDIDREHRSLDIMGTTVYFDVDSIPVDSTLYADRNHNDCYDCCIDFDDVQIGDRILVRVLRVPSQSASGVRLLVGLRIMKWSREFEIVHGRVDEILERLDGRVELIRVLDTTVLITNDTIIKPRM